MSVKFETLYHNLKEKAIAFSPGDYFLSFRDIMSNFKVSQATASRAIGMLRDNGILDKDPGKGFVVTEEVLNYREDAKPVICLALPRWVSHWYMAIEDVFEQLQGELGYTLTIMRYDWHEGLPRCLPAGKTDALVIAPSAEHIDAQLYKVLEDLEVPYVLFGNRYSGLQAASVSSDYEYGGALAAKHLIDLGHRKMLALEVEGFMESSRLWIKSFCQMCELDRIEVETVKLDTRQGENIIGKGYDFFHQRLKTQKKFDCTGLFIPSSYCVPGALKALYEAGLGVPKDVSLVTVGEWEVLDYIFPAVTRISASIPEMVEAAIGKLLKQKAGNKDTTPVLLKQELIVRESTAKLKK